MKKPIPNSVCDDCINTECVWRAPSCGIDPPVMDCPDKKAPPVTHYDLLVRKTPEELAHFMEMKAGRFVSFYPTPAKTWLDWLKLEAETDG